jgi:hypothetical protein
MIAAVPRFVDFVRHGLQLSPILDDLHAEMNGAIEQMREADRRGRADLTTLWRQHADSAAPYGWSRYCAGAGRL